MKIIVPIKRVVDANVHIRVRSDQTGVDTENVKMSINPFCEIALEEAVRIKEAGGADEVMVVTIGDAACADILKTGLAMGADRALHVETNEKIHPLGVAKILREIVNRENPGLVILGKLAVDDENNQTGQMLAALLNWGQGTFASRVVINDDEVEVTREVDGGLETVSLKLPAVITSDLRLNEPRYVKLPDLMKAKKKTVEKSVLSEWNMDFSSKIDLLKVEEPSPRPAGVKVKSVSDLVDRLRNEAKVI